MTGRQAASYQKVKTVNSSWLQRRRGSLFDELRQDRRDRPDLQAANEEFPRVGGEPDGAARHRLLPAATPLRRRSRRRSCHMAGHGFDRATRELLRRSASCAEQG